MNNCVRVLGNAWVRVQLKAAREKERADLIRRGIIDDPDNRKPLSEALIFVGTCMEMCPMFEREERQFQKNVDKMEIVGIQFTQISLFVH